MTSRQKRHFHCQKCGNPCTIYKKGKGHRVLVCPECGIVATNPMKMGTGVISRFARTVRTLPFAETAFTGAEQLGILEPDSQTASAAPIPSPHRLTPFEKALLLERLEKN